MHNFFVVNEESEYTYLLFTVVQGGLKYTVWPSSIVSTIFFREVEWFCLICGLYTNIEQNKAKSS